MAGEHTLILAPTGSGKTLAAFLWGIDRLVTSPPVDDRARRTRVLYISPLRALAVDVEKNLRSPLVGVRLAAERLAAERGETAVVHQPTVAIRSGDTPADERRRQQRNPPDLLITTPESLYLLLTSAARDTLLGVEAVIIDEIHAMAGTKRGAHLALTLERLEARADRPPQRIGLSATQRPLDEIARFLGGHEASGRPRPVTVVDAGSRKQLDVEVIVPVDDMGDLSVGGAGAHRGRPHRLGCAAPQHLAGVAPAPARPGAAAPLHAGVRQRPPLRRAPRHAAQRAGQHRAVPRAPRPTARRRPWPPTWCAPTTAPSAASSAS